MGNKKIPKDGTKICLLFKLNFHAVG